MRKKLKDPGARLAVSAIQELTVKLKRFGLAFLISALSRSCIGSY